MITFSTDLHLPQTATVTGVPATWVDDKSISFAALGFLSTLASYADQDVISEHDVSSDHPDDPPMPDVIAELVAAGYLVLRESDHYEIVDPNAEVGVPARGTQSE